MRLKRLKNHKALLESFFSLSILNGLNALLPLVTLPYILRIIGVEKYGVYAYVYTIIGYILLVSGYGFSFSATKQIAQCRDEKHKINIIYNSVIFARFFLMFACLAILMLFSFMLLESPDKKFLFVMGLGIVIGDIINPVWLFQGMQKMRYLTIANASSKILFTILIFIFIQKSDDYRFITFINGLGYLLAGLISSIIAHKQFKIKFFVPTRQQILFQLKQGAPLFGTTVGTNLYSNTNVFILKFFVSESALGFYAAAERLIRGLQMLTSTVINALFPYIGKDFVGKSIHYKIKQIWKIASVLFAALLIPTIILFFCADYLVNLICGRGYEESAFLFKIMCPIVTIGIVSPVLGIIGLVNLEKQIVYFYAVMAVGFFNVLFLVFLAPHWGNVSASIALVLSEIILGIICITVILGISKKNSRQQSAPVVESNR